MELRPSVTDDIPQILSWMSQDPFHKESVEFQFWLTGNPECLFAAKVVDKDGVTLGYARADDDFFGLRLHIQFAPSTEISRRRVVVAALDFIRKVKSYAKTIGKKGLITESNNPELILFLKKMGFKDAGNNDFILSVED